MSQIVIPDEALIREPSLLVPGRKPVGPVRVDWSHPLARGLSLCWLAGQNVNLVDGALPLVDGRTFVGSEFGRVQTFNRTSLASVYWDKEYVKTSNGAGTGDHTFVFRGNPVAESDPAVMVGQKWDSGGSPYNQGVLMANANASFGVAAGRVSYVTYSGGTVGVSISNAVDGNWHTFFGGVIGGVVFVGVDSGGIVTGAAPQDISDGNRYTLVGNGGKGSNADCYSGEAAFAYAFDRALSTAERLAIYLDPYQFLIPA